MNEESCRQVLSQLGVEVVSRSAKGWLQARCPLAFATHLKGEDRSPSFAVHVNDEGTSHYKCLTCHYSGRLAQLVRTLERLHGHSYGSLAVDCEMQDALGIFGDGFERSASADTDEVAAIDETMVQGLYPPAHTVIAARTYLENRGVRRRAIDELEILYDPDERRVLFPCRGRSGQLYGFTGRTILPERQWPYGSYKKVRDYLGLPKASILLGLNLVQPDKPSLVVEGLIGLARLVQEGVRDICNPLALLGSEMTGPKASLLAELDQATFLMVDPDAAGEACLWGRIDPRTGQHSGYGAVKTLLDKGVQVFVPEWPVDDVDLLTLGDVREILARCPPYGWE